VDASWRGVPVKHWGAFADQQINLLVEAGFSREHAQQLYAQVK
jgi:hypothetical protein